MLGDVLQVGCDRSSVLCAVCCERGHQVYIADMLSVSLRSASVDAAVCIAALHHLSTVVSHLNREQSTIQTATVTVILINAITFDGCAKCRYRKCIFIIRV